MISMTPTSDLVLLSGAKTGHVDGSLRACPRTRSRGIFQSSYGRGLRGEGAGPGLPRREDRTIGQT